MRIGLLSDTHDDLGNLKKALDRFRQEGISTIIHCGDLTRPVLARQFAPFRVIYLFGNMDGDRAAIDRIVSEQNDANFAGQQFVGQLEGVSIAATHGHLEQTLQELIKGGQHRYVFHGHTHRQRDERHGPTRLINPGALGGVRYEPRSIAILDLDADTLSFIEIAQR
ncbi:MAG: metallophosphoesterase [Candidatus Promineifilaceae bacterium]|nr:metallophosphoesterase [Candidatus Promineifilaceae bacterium]